MRSAPKVLSRGGIVYGSGEESFEGGEAARDIMIEDGTPDVMRDKMTGIEQGGRFTASGVIIYA